jgi:hypothetical protein
MSGKCIGTLQFIELVKACWMYVVIISAVFLYVFDTFALGELLVLTFRFSISSYIIYTLNSVNKVSVSFTFFLQGHMHVLQLNLSSPRSL